MRKNILSKFIILMGFLFSFALNAGNKENFNNFEKFSARMSNNPDYISYAIISGNGNKYPVQLNVGNYLAFMPSRYAAINVYEFLSDTLKKDFKIIKINKKGKTTNESKIIKYSPNDFFSNYTENTDSEKSEMKSMGMVFAGVKNVGAGEYKITAYGNKGISGGTFSIENGKIEVTDKKGKHYMSIYQKDNSLFVEMAKYNVEFKINQAQNQLEYWINHKLKYVEKYQVI